MNNLFYEAVLLFYIILVENLPQSEWCSSVFGAMDPRFIVARRCAVDLVFYQGHFKSPPFGTLGLVGRDLSSTGILRIQNWLTSHFCDCGRSVTHSKLLISRIANKGK